MTVNYGTVLSLLGKEVSFSVLLDDQNKIFFPDGIHISGSVEKVVIDLTGNHEILVGAEYYELSRIDLLI